MSRINDFDPNHKGRSLPEWATYIPDRNPAWKVHKGLGQAKNAFQYRKEAALYQWEGSQWVEKFRVDQDPDPEFCQMCPVSLWKASPYDPSKLHYYGRRRWVPGELRRVIVCQECERELK